MSIEEVITKGEGEAVMNFTILEIVGEQAAALKLVPGWYVGSGETDEPIATQELVGPHLTEQAAVDSVETIVQMAVLAALGLKLEGEADFVDETEIAEFADDTGFRGFAPNGRPLG